jgi:hypothetical protein
MVEHGDTWNQFQKEFDSPARAGVQLVMAVLKTRWLID